MFYSHLVLLPSPLFSSSSGECTFVSRYKHSIRPNGYYKRKDRGLFLTSESAALSSSLFSWMAKAIRLWIQAYDATQRLWQTQARGSLPGIRERPSTSSRFTILDGQTLSSLQTSTRYEPTVIANASTRFISWYQSASFSLFSFYFVGGPTPSVSTYEHSIRPNDCSDCQREGLITIFESAAYPLLLLSVEWQKHLVSTYKHSIRPNDCSNYQNKRIISVTESDLLLSSPFSFPVGKSISSLRANTGSNPTTFLIARTEGSYSSQRAAYRTAGSN